MILGSEESLLSTRMKSFPRPWYLTKWRIPVSFLSRKASGESFSAAKALMEVAETRRLVLLKERFLLPERLKRREGNDLEKVCENWRDCGEARVTVFVAAISIDASASFVSCLNSL